MRIRGVSLTVVVVTVLLSNGAVFAADPPIGQPSYGHGSEVKMPSGVIGVSLHVGAERIGDPAILYVGMVHPEGPAHQAGLRHGDEVVTVNGTAVAGRSYDQVVMMIRGEPGSVVKLGIKCDAGIKEVPITRVSGENLSKGPQGSHGGPSR